MNCDVCRRSNLSGGLRCAYCGAYLPPSFDLTAESSPSETVANTSPAPGESNDNLTKTVQRAGFLGGLVLLLFKAKSLLTLFQLGKILTTLASMGVFIWVDAKLFGWKFGVGIAISILIHELGHVFVNWRKGIPQSAPMFIPFVGAVIFVKQFPNDPTAQSESGAGGPVAGTLAAVGCLGLYHLTGDMYWLALANFGFAINLFNLLPFPPLDGSHIAQVFSPGIWNVVLVAMLLWAIKVPGAMLWLIFIVGLITRLSMGESSRHLLAPPIVRARMAVIYLLLCLGLSYGAEKTLSARHLLREAMQNSLATAPATSETPAPTPSPVVTPTPEPLPPPVASRPMTDAETKDLQTAIAAMKSEERSQRLTYFIGIGVGVSLLWAIAVAWLASVGRSRFGPAEGKLLVALFGVTALSVVGTFLLTESGNRQGITLLGGAAAAAGMALLHVAYQAIRLRGVWIWPAPPLLRTHLLGWAFVGASLVAYYTGSLPLVGMLFVLATGFYALHSWMIPALQARLFESLGDRERALNALNLAVHRCPEPAAKAELYEKIARLNLALARGADALDAQQKSLENEQSAAYTTVSPRIPTGLREMMRLNLRSDALVLMGRYEESLACYEQMLTLTGGDPRTAPLAEFYVHANLAQMALLREWYDEAEAQAQWGLARVASTAASLTALLHLFLAKAQANQDRPADAETNIETALKMHHDVSIRADAAVIRCQMALNAGETQKAADYAEQALRLVPGNLSVLHWRGRCGSPEILERLAREFPNDYWGQRAGALLKTAS
jgi:tetratricopeptide (TPR) repeat protein/Zn-dependent protease